jgi:hypothetical protein
MTNQDRIRRLLAIDRRFDHVPEAVVAKVARMASPNATDAELLASLAEGCSSQSRQYRKGGWPYRASALERLARRLQEAAHRETANREATPRR